jgi:hypothetical protein
MARNREKNLVWRRKWWKKNARRLAMKRRQQRLDPEFRKRDKENRRQWWRRNRKKQSIIDRRRAYRKKYRRKTKIRMRHWYVKNRDSIIRRVEARYRKKKRSINRHKAAWYIRNRTQHLHMQKLWRCNNRDVRRELARRRYARKKGCTIGDVRATAAFYHHVQSARVIKCHWCKRRVPRKQRTVDHVIPLCRGGKHCVTNLVPACRRCNCRKKDKLPSEFLRFLR